MHAIHLLIVKGLVSDRPLSFAVDIVDKLLFLYLYLLFYY